MLVYALLPVKSGLTRTREKSIDFFITKDLIGSSSN